jgi:hypothetical protein
VSEIALPAVYLIVVYSQACGVLDAVEKASGEPSSLPLHTMDKIKKIKEMHRQMEATMDSPSPIFNDSKRGLEAFEKKFASFCAYEKHVLKTVSTLDPLHTG